MCMPKSTEFVAHVRAAFRPVSHSLYITCLESVSIELAILYLLFDKPRFELALVTLSSMV